MCVCEREREREGLYFNHYQRLKWESNGRKSSYLSSQKVEKEAIFKSKELGFLKILRACLV